MVEVRPTILEVPHSDIPQVFEKLAPKLTSIHIDVEDGQFVPRKNDFSPDFVSWIHDNFKLRIDVHLMVNNPDKEIINYVKAGADIISFHQEATHRTDELVELIKAQGAKACLALKLETPIESSQPYWEELEEILLMSVNPGLGGQVFNPEALVRIKDLRKKGWSGKIKMDGGIKVGVARQCALAGANVLVAGNAIFNSGNMEEAYDILVADTLK